MVMDFNYPTSDPACDSINFSYHNRFRADFNDLRFSTVGNDIYIELVIKPSGGSGGTVILKNAVLNLVTVDESNITFINGLH